ncbi:glycosyltransferase [Granulosicoccaceae sp. 1_MG-2023]|nr:glycosyltransferase [Granulosicoccaceae sp. 1_MG-2023]
MKHTILVISPFFYPEAISTGKYNTHMVEALRDAGHDVDVICSYPLYPAWRPAPTDKQLDGVRITRGGLRVRYPASAVLRRLCLEAWFAMFARKAVRQKQKEYSKVVLIYPPNLAGVLTARLFRESETQLVGIVHDLQGVLIKAENGLFRRLVFRGVKMLERAAFNSVDSLIYLSENMRANANAAYPGLKPASEVAYPFVSVDEQAGAPRDYFNNGKLNIVYSGALGEKQNPEGLLALFVALAQDERFRCHIFSAGRVFEQLKAKSNGSGVEFHPLVPQEDLISLLSSSALQVVPQVLDTSDGAFPSKIPNIVSLNTPLLCITPEHGELHKLLSSSGRALLCGHWGVEKIKEEVRRFLLEGGVADTYEPDLITKFDVKDLVEKITG